SSRRRHTRFSRDWSSDVCSSDLVDPPAATPQATLRMSYTAADDYGVTKARAVFRRTYERGEVVGKETLEVELPLPSRSAKSVQRSEEHTSELQSRENLVCRLLLE